MKKDRDRVLLYFPWHPDADEKGYVYRYRIVAEMTLRRPLWETEIVHHVDGDASNDVPENLVVFNNQAEHSRHHGYRRPPEQMAAMRAAKDQK